MTCIVHQNAIDTGSYFTILCVVDLLRSNSKGAIHSQFLLILMNLNLWSKLLLSTQYINV